MNNKTQPEGLIEILHDACDRIMPDFQELHESFLEIHPEWARNERAGNLMEFGRGQISKPDEPSRGDLVLIAEYVDRIDITNDNAYFFCAYASGCLMGWVQTGELPPDLFFDALRVIQERSIGAFP